MSLGAITAGALVRTNARLRSRRVRALIPDFSSFFLFVSRSMGLRSFYGCNGRATVVSAAFCMVERKGHGWP